MGRRTMPLIFLLALATGTGIGLLVSWGFWPVEYTDVAPSSLSAPHKEEYLVLVSMSFAHNHDLGLAQKRLSDLGDLAQVSTEVVALAEKYAAEGKAGGQAAKIRALTALAFALGYRRAALAPYMPDIIPTATWTPWPLPTPTPTLTPTATETPLPTSTETPFPPATPDSTVTGTPVEPGKTPSLPLTETPTASLVPTETPIPTEMPTPTSIPTPTLATPVTRYQVIEQQQSCEPPGGQLMVTVLDAAGQPQPSVELLVRWDGGSERFFTGLKPEQGVGYADLAMSKERIYELVVVGIESDVAQNLTADLCENGRLASWNVVFRLNR